MKKRYILLSTVVVLLLLVWTNQEEKELQGKEQLIEKVKQMEVTKEIEIKNHKVELVLDATPIINNDENLSEDETVHPKMCIKSQQGSLESEKFILDSEGKIEAVEVDANKDGVLERKSFYTYDDRGNILKVKTEKYQDNKHEYYNERFGDSYFYNDDYYEIPTQISTVTNEYDDKNNLISKRFEMDGYTSLILYEYNEKGDVKKETSYRNGELDLIRDVIYQYDEKGRKIKQHYHIVYMPRPILFYDSKDLPQEYVYNKKGELIKKVIMGYRQAYVYKYNNNSQVISEKIYIIKSNGEIIKNSKPRFGRFYKYDENGNLIEKVDDSGSILFKATYGFCNE